MHRLTTPVGLQGRRHRILAAVVHQECALQPQGQALPQAAPDRGPMPLGSRHSGHNVGGGKHGHMPGTGLAGGPPVPVRPCLRTPINRGILVQTPLSRDAGWVTSPYVWPALCLRTGNPSGRDGCGLDNRACMVGNAAWKMSRPWPSTPVRWPGPAHGVGQAGPNAASASDGRLGSFPDRKFDY